MRLTRNVGVLGGCFALVVSMVGASYAAVPLYYMFCRATGYGGTPNRADAAPGATGDRIITVRFDTNVDPALPWSFAPETRSVQVKVGEDRLVFFHAVNKSNVAVVGHAAFNVAPDAAARYFPQIQCFCFTQPRLQAGESLDMPVSFFVAPGILSDCADGQLPDINLSCPF